MTENQILLISRIKTYCRERDKVKAWVDEQTRNLRIVFNYQCPTWVDYATATNELWEIINIIGETE